MPDKYKEYTNLKEGDYTFEMKAINIYGQESQVARYQFEVAPPWYRSFWAYLLYCSLAGLLINGITRYYSARLKKENEHLEATIRERTEEVEQQRKVLEKSNGQLKRSECNFVFDNRTRKRFGFNQSSEKSVNGSRIPSLKTF